MSEDKIAREVSEKLIETLCQEAEARGGLSEGQIIIAVEMTLGTLAGRFARRFCEHRRRVAIGRLGQLAQLYAEDFIEGDTLAQHPTTTAH